MRMILMFKYSYSTISTLCCPRMILLTVQLIFGVRDDENDSHVQVFLLDYFDLVLPENDSTRSATNF